MVGLADARRWEPVGIERAFGCGVRAGTGWREIPQPLSVAPVRLVEPAGADLGAGRPCRDLSRRRLGNVVEVAEDDEPPLLAPAEQVGRRRSDGCRLHRSPIQRVDGEAGALSLVARSEPKLPARIRRECQQLRLEVSRDQLDRRPANLDACAQRPPAHLQDVGTVVIDLDRVQLGREERDRLDVGRGSRDIYPTRMGRWPGSTFAVSQCHLPPTRLARSVSASGSPTSCTASTSGSIFLMTSAKALSWAAYAA